MSNTVSGMAAAIRGATESDTFDLAGQSVSSVTNTIQSAFGEPFSLEQMIRITFVTGAGKLGRQKYDDNAAKAVTSTLRELGFQEDRGASCVLECAGSFKLQHDTGKNLKTVVVFPRIHVIPVSTATEPSQPTHGTPTPQHLIATSSTTLFTKMLTTQCPSWSQKKASLQIMADIRTTLASLDAKLVQGTPLTEQEQDFYDSVVDLDEKEAIVRKEMQSCVEQGRLTQKEKTKLIGQVNDKLDLLKKEEQSTTDANNIQQLNKQYQAGSNRKQKLEQIKAKTPHPLKHESDIQTLRAEMRPLLKLEQEANGRLLTLKESIILARKDEIMEEIEQLESQSRGWFEEDADFQARVQQSRTAAAAKEKQLRSKSNKKSNASSTGYKAKSVTSWTSSGTKKAVTKRPVKTSNATSGGMFAAMMDDSDSD